MDTQIYAAILGALIAFGLVLIRDWIGKVFERKKKHYDALVRLESQLQDQGGVIHDNIYQLSPFIDALERGALYWSD
ncbi:hypothetical protein EPN95_01745 [Patescibacteria group bacterium]|nr:MAG: hypothetical protein EPN95_01745 [Patescibacteria group bacterium]